MGFITAGAGLWLMLPSTGGRLWLGLQLSKWLVLPLVIALTVLLLRLIPGEISAEPERASTASSTTSTPGR